VADSQKIFKQFRAAYCAAAIASFSNYLIFKFSNNFSNTVLKPMRKIVLSAVVLVIAFTSCTRYFIGKPVQLRLVAVSDTVSAPASLAFSTDFGLSPALSRHLRCSDEYGFGKITTQINQRDSRVGIGQFDDRYFS
jgi:hypothetical protein